MSEQPQPRCRYSPVSGCSGEVTHYCEECASGASGLSGYFCAAHAVRHDRLVREALQDAGVDEKNAILAKPISGNVQSPAPPPGASAEQ